MASGRLLHAGGSYFHHVEELPGFLRRLHSDDLTRNKPKVAAGFRLAQAGTFVVFADHFCVVWDEAVARKAAEPPLGDGVSCRRCVRLTEGISVIGYEQ